MTESITTISTKPSTCDTNINHLHNNRDIIIKTLATIFIIMVFVIISIITIRDSNKKQKGYVEHLYMEDKNNVTKQNSIKRIKINKDIDQTNNQHNNTSKIKNILPVKSHIKSGTENTNEKKSKGKGGIDNLKLDKCGNDVVITTMISSTVKSFLNFKQYVSLLKVNFNDLRKNLYIRNLEELNNTAGYTSRYLKELIGNGCSLSDKVIEIFINTNNDIKYSVSNMLEQFDRLLSPTNKILMKIDTYYNKSTTQKMLTNNTQISKFRKPDKMDGLFTVLRNINNDVHRDLLILIRLLEEVMIQDREYKTIVRK